MIVSYAELAGTLERALAALGLEPDRAPRCAQLIADSTRDGVPSHGLNLFPRVASMIRRGAIDPRARAIRVAGRGALERWDGRRGVGALNAFDAMQAAIAGARASGIACVALGNTNHWMRGGSYGWQAADAGAIALCWTNTLPNLPPWGAASPRIGNNPLVVAVPRARGHVVLDMAMSQFSYGALASYRARGERLPVAGGFDRDGRLTDDPAAIEASRRPLPIGFWKGSGLAIVLDIIAAALAGGRATHEIGADPEQETGLSQVFIAIDPASLEGAAIDGVADAVVASVQARYPGERTLAARRQHLQQGIEVDDEAWTIARRCASA
ncbi:MAG: 3-dehydro-L-gulonate 2-dehydrogenase [Acidobacteria bacterium]|nr:MAG: 3-dehydro-L-gulonate 2-dehydrogenase [Acidobacteriota bacterium]